MSSRLSNLSNRAVLLILVIVALASSGLSVIVNLTSDHASFAEWGESWLQNFSTEMFGAFLTFILIELIVGGREKRRDEERSTDQEKARLIRQMRSSVSTESIKALEEVRIHGWLRDGALRGADLQTANLKELDLELADLQGTNLARAKLQGANLAEANLQDANLVRADLQGANLAEANLQGTNLTEANLENVTLFAARFTQKKISDRFDGTTKLPHGRNWTPRTDMARFTDPNHPQFWRSNNPNSPAYRSKSKG